MVQWLRVLPALQEGFIKFPAPTFGVLQLPTSPNLSGPVYSSDLWQACIAYTHKEIHTNTHMN